MPFEQNHIKLESKLRSAIQQAFLAIYNLSVSEEACSLQITRKEFQGTFSLPVFPFCKACKVAPILLADKIGQWLETHISFVASYNVINGFLNLLIDDATWIAILTAIGTDTNYGTSPKSRGNIVVEFSCPNTNKPQHLGHLRNNFLGGSLAAILETAGYRVHKVNLINDRGIHICKSMVAYEQFGNNETPESSAIKGDHLVGKYYVKFDQVYKAEEALMKHNGQNGEIPPILQAAQNMLVKWEKNDPYVMALWKKMNGWVYDGFDATYAALNITFDKIYYESQAYLLGKTIVEEGLEKKIFYKRTDNAIAVDLSREGLGEKVLLRSDGTSVYITQDLGIADWRYADYHFDKMIYVVGNEQTYHFKVLFAIMAQLGRTYAASMYHFPYGMVDLPDGKMKSREGNVVDADTLIEEMVATVKNYMGTNHKIEELSQEALQKLHHTLAIGALKFFLLRVAPNKKMLFNPNESIDFQGDTGTFIQYTYARICSLARKGKQIQSLPSDVSMIRLNQLEQNLIFQLYRFPATVEEAATTYMPSVIAQYALELAKTYNKFYGNYSILREPSSELKRFRLMLSIGVGKILKQAMALLTIDLPERM